jgi:hypothetical protein
VDNSSTRSQVPPKSQGMKPLTQLTQLTPPVENLQISQKMIHYY